LIEVRSAAPSALPRITIATVVFNGAAGIARTIESTLEQDYPHMETVVVDGGSTDGTQAIVGRFADAIDVFVSEPDHGIYDAMNKAVARASGEFLLFMNSGDTFAGAGALSAAAHGLVAGTETVVFGAWDRLNASGAREHRRPSLASGLFNHQSVIYSRSLHRRFGGYVNVRGFTTADYLFFMTLVESGSVACTCIDTTVAVIDIGGVSAGPQTLSQKVAVDFLLGRASRAKLLAVLAGHPTYRRARALLKRLR
jgi:glycosyltransferase involved in cell wall biosynthesis